MRLQCLLRIFMSEFVKDEIMRFFLRSFLWCVSTLICISFFDIALSGLVIEILAYETVTL